MATKGCAVVTDGDVVDEELFLDVDADSDEGIQTLARKQIVNNDGKGRGWGGGLLLTQRVVEKGIVLSDEEEEEYSAKNIQKKKNIQSR